MLNDTFFVIFKHRVYVVTYLSKLLMSSRFPKVGMKRKLHKSSRESDKKTSELVTTEFFTTELLTTEFCTTEILTTERWKTELLDSSFF